MRKWLLAPLTALLVLLPAIAFADDTPFEDGEILRYQINWPSGLGLGEAEMSAKRADDGSWKFRLSIDAAVPGFGVSDEYRATADAGLCSLEFRKELSHGERTTHERTEFDQAAGTARRITLNGGGESEIAIPKCGKDGLTFLYHLRQELSRGRVPAPAPVLFGATYEVRFQAVGTEKAVVSKQSYEADNLMVTVKGPASESTFLVLVARDPARTITRITAPLEPGNFTMDLVQK